jgi:hypothetical protein
MEGTSAYRYFRDPRSARVRARDGRLFGIYADALPQAAAWVDGTFPGEPSPRARAR